MASSTAIFATSDLLGTVAHYKDILGFESSWTWGEPPTFGSVSMGGVSIMFSLQPDLAARVAGLEHWVSVEDADELYSKHINLGAKIVSPIEDKPWGVREYTVEDPSGYRLRFAGPLTGPVTKSAPFPDGVRIECRKPTAEEHANVSGKQFNYDGQQAQLLASTWGGVVAVSGNDEVIGVVRIMLDAPGWFSIWDVAVLPEWQGQNIGTSMMREALSLVRTASPGASVHLFTYKHGFYERLGFSKDSVSLIRL